MGDGPADLRGLVREQQHRQVGVGADQRRLMVGMVAGGGAATSTTLAGAISDYVGAQFAFLGLGAIAMLAVAAVLLLVPETRPEQ